MIEDGGSPDRSIVELVSTTYLKEGRNFYDQAPFDLVTTKLSDNSGIPLEVLRKTLSSLCRNSDGRFRSLTSGEQADAIKYNPWLPDLEKRFFPKQKEVKIIYRTTTIDVFVQLGIYPRWVQYIFENLHRGYYSLDGRQLIQKSSVRTYPQWLEDTIKHERNKKLIGLYDVLPEGYSMPQSLNDHLRETGKGLEWRRWRFLVSGGFIPEK